MSAGRTVRLSKAQTQQITALVRAQQDAYLQTLGRIERRPVKPLPFFLDPAQVAELCPEIDWTERVSARIRAFVEWGRDETSTKIGQLPR